MTNNPRKFVGIEGYGLKVVERVPIAIAPQEGNAHYLWTKKSKLGPLLNNVSGGTCGSRKQVVHTPFAVLSQNGVFTDSPNSMKVFEGNLDGTDCSIGIVLSKFNEPVTSRLLAGAEEVLRQLGAAPEQIQLVRVPGAFELPLAAKALAHSQQVDAIICLGAVIRGETPHFDYISEETCRGIGRVALETGIPVIFGVLTTNTVEQAMDRSGTLERNKGADAARTAIEMISLMKQLHAANVRQSGFLR